MSYLLGNVLVDKQNGDILALIGEAIEGCLDGRVFSLGIDDEEVLLSVRRGSDMLNGLLEREVIQEVRGGRRTPTPARSMPVTVSCD